MIFENFPFDRNSLNIFLPIIDDEEQRRLEELEEEEEWAFLTDEESDKDHDEFEEDF